MQEALPPSAVRPTGYGPYDLGQPGPRGRCCVHGGDRPGAHPTSAVRSAPGSPAGADDGATSPALGASRRRWSAGRWSPAPARRSPRRPGACATGRSRRWWSRPAAGPGDRLGPPRPGAGRRPKRRHAGGGGDDRPAADHAGRRRPWARCSWPWSTTASTICRWSGRGGWSAWSPTPTCCGTSPATRCSSDASSTGRPAQRSLAAYAREVAAAAVRLIGAGSPAGDVTRFVASAHDALYVRVARDGEAALGPPPCPYALLVLGSGARAGAHPAQRPGPRAGAGR